VKQRAQPGQIVAVDSEHNALAQCLRAGRADEVRRLVLTASGGPFRGRTRDELADVTPEQALAHPPGRWARWSPPTPRRWSTRAWSSSRPTCSSTCRWTRSTSSCTRLVVHSMVEFVDGSTLAQASPPDMRIPIALGRWAWPDRVPDAAPACDWTSPTTWEFFPLDDEAFPAVRLARAAGAAGGTAPGGLQRANEVAVHAFLAGRLPFTAIVDTVAATLDAHTVGNVATLDDVEQRTPGRGGRPSGLGTVRETTQGSSGWTSWPSSACSSSSSA
jgi:1-deoxy-D-xylulose-5-phosphate reductoisomerase